MNREHLIATLHDRAVEVAEYDTGHTEYGYGGETTDYDRVSNWPVVVAAILDGAEPTFASPEAAARAAIEVAFARCTAVRVRDARELEHMARAEAALAEAVRALDECWPRDSFG